MAIKSVTLNYNGHYGALDYNEETKELTVTIKGETQIEQKVMDFLAAPHKMEVPIDACTYHFEERTFLARDSWKDCQQVLTPSLGQYRAFLVEWSMPPHMVEDL